MGHKFWPKNSIQRRKNWPDSYVERVWAKNLPNVRFMLAFASQRNVEFFLACPKPGTWTSLFQYEFTYVGSCSIFQVLGCSTIRLSSYGTLHCHIHVMQHKGWDYQNNMGREPKFFVIFSLLHVINRCTMIHHLQYNHLPFKKNLFKCFHQFYKKMHEHLQHYITFIKSAMENVLIVYLFDSGLKTREI